MIKNLIVAALILAAHACNGPCGCKKHQYCHKTHKCLPMSQCRANNNIGGCKGGCLLELNQAGSMNFQSANNYEQPQLIDTRSISTMQQDSRFDQNSNQQPVDERFDQDPNQLIVDGSNVDEQQQQQQPVETRTVFANTMQDSTAQGERNGFPQAPLQPLPPIQSASASAYDGSVEQPEDTRSISTMQQDSRFDQNSNQQPVDDQNNQIIQNQPEIQSDGGSDKQMLQQDGMLVETLASMHASSCNGPCGCKKHQYCHKTHKCLPMSQCRANNNIGGCKGGCLLEQDGILAHTHRTHAFNPHTLNLLGYSILGCMALALASVVALAVVVRRSVRAVTVEPEEEEEEEDLV